ncbi:MAG: hypothetical protein UDB11_03910 [Peptococcaceae bacterium]|nr:hypothetical protein [Peptococcaceae bacterium]
MRIFMMIVTLFLACACVVLNVLGYNGTLSFLQFLLISAAAELLLCLLLGHFMYRTYANYKRAKATNQALTNAQAALQLKEKEVMEARENAAAAHTQASASTKENSAIISPDADITLPRSAVNEQPINDADTTTLYKTPFGQ